MKKDSKKINQGLKLVNQIQKIRSKNNKKKIFFLNFLSITKISNKRYVFFFSILLTLQYLFLKRVYPISLVFA